LITHENEAVSELILETVQTIVELPSSLLLTGLLTDFTLRRVPGYPWQISFISRKLAADALRQIKIRFDNI
jgi:hypothetical protein